MTTAHPAAVREIQLRGEEIFGLALQVAEFSNFTGNVRQVQVLGGVRRIVATSSVLQTRKQYHFRLAAWNSAGQGTWSPSKAKCVL